MQPGNATHNVLHSEATRNMTRPSMCLPIEVPAHLYGMLACMDTCRQLSEDVWVSGVSDKGMAHNIAVQSSKAGGA